MLFEQPSQGFNEDGGRRLGAKFRVRTADFFDSTFLRDVTVYLDIKSTRNNSNLQGKSKKVRVIGSSSYWELEENSRE